MHTETDTCIALSALQHYLFCPRQCALIHVEQAWAENRFTMEGNILHERTNKTGHESRRGVRVVTAMPLGSQKLKVSGIADLVELHADNGTWLPYPIEYKRGKPKAHRADEVQLCAQAICLEEMFARPISEGALYYGEPKRRTTIEFSDDLRDLTAKVAQEAHTLISSSRTPLPKYKQRACRSCSLVDICKPKRLERQSSTRTWLNNRIAEIQ